jgi:hypothetical protein
MRFLLESTAAQLVWVSQQALNNVYFVSPIVKPILTAAISASAYGHISAGTTTHKPSSPE